MSVRGGRVSFTVVGVAAATVVMVDFTVVVVVGFTVVGVVATTVVRVDFTVVIVVFTVVVVEVTVVVPRASVLSNTITAMTAAMAKSGSIDLRMSCMRRPLRQSMSGEKGTLQLVTLGSHWLEVNLKSSE